MKSFGMSYKKCPTAVTWLDTILLMLNQERLSFLKTSGWLNVLSLIEEAGYSFFKNPIKSMGWNLTWCSSHYYLCVCEDIYR